jgi:hypothetical protein
MNEQQLDALRALFPGVKDQQLDVLRAFLTVPQHGPRQASFWRRQRLARGMCPIHSSQPKTAMRVPGVGWVAQCGNKGCDVQLVSSAPFGGPLHGQPPVPPDVRLLSDHEHLLEPNPADDADLVFLLGYALLRTQRRLPVDVADRIRGVVRDLAARALEDAEMSVPAAARPANDR